MKRLIPLTLFGLLLTACQTPKVNAGNDNQTLVQKLVHHNFVLTKVNGKTIRYKQTLPSISFGENMFTSATMCNEFNGIASITDSKILVTSISKTELECVDEDLSKLDILINKMLTKGATVTYSHNQLVLTQGPYSLVYMLRDYIN
ncbi:META domain-containing protein [Providencia sp. Je.9.19]|uniref:META domain-containing protein n=1 Tax=Providencia sp. Je.9.19 TaxID=3142844 RepID=UPI003DA884C8